MPGKDKQIDIKEITNIGQAKELFRRGRLTHDGFRHVLEDEIGRDPNFWIPAKEAAPEAVGNDKSRNRFKWHHLYNEKGQAFQSLVKKAILSAIDMGHMYWRTKYDKNAFVYEDGRLIFFDEFLKQYIKELVSERGAFDNYKMNFMNKLVDIVLGLCKEDIYYRSRFFNCINMFVQNLLEIDYPIIELTEDELRNLVTFK